MAHAKISDSTKQTIEWSHDALAEDLARHLAGEHRMVWENLQLGPSGSPRPDVYTIDKSYVSPNPRAYECKIRRSDFLADVTVAKWRAYLEYAHSVCFAVPLGLVAKGEVPEMCGLIVRNETGWRMAKRATVNPRPIAQEALLKLLIDGVEREGPKIRAKSWHLNSVGDKFAAKFGSEAARYVIDAATTHQRIEQAQHQADLILERAREAAKTITDNAHTNAPVFWAQLLEVLGLKPEASRWDVERVIRELRAERDGTKEARALREVLQSLNHIIQQKQEFIEIKEFVPV